MSLSVFVFPRLSFNVGRYTSRFLLGDSHFVFTLSTFLNHTRHFRRTHYPCFEGTHSMTFKGPSHWHRIANTSCLALRFLVITMATGDAYPREFVALALEFPSTLASALRRAREAPNTNPIIFFFQCEGPFTCPAMHDTSGLARDVAGG